MNTAPLLSALVLACALAAPGAVSPAVAATGFECPARPLDVPGDKRVQAALPTGDGLDRVEALNAAVINLRGQGVNPVLIIDGLIAAYCPTVASQQLTDAEKTARVSRFAARITRVVYALDSAEAIILDVPLAPATLDAVTAKASALGVSPEAWVRGVVTQAVQ
ncbi:hypothetical protein [Ancylobacter terrae]|uniref:hypothetical protein n=1 Tax=Ancylobacter sp. sgz301288 TaxID=3342077 RepID=UPI00385D88FD